MDPRYLVVADALRERIRGLPPGSPLPGEHELAARFGVSRVTVRRALSLLERTGLVSRQRGRGTTVNPPKIERWLAPSHPLEDDFRQQGRQFETRVIECKREMLPPEFVSERLRLAPG